VDDLEATGLVPPDLEDLLAVHPDPEDAQLLALLESKMDRPLIARKLKRTVAAITIRLMVLRGKTK
jgi:hypothetical protein